MENRHRALVRAATSALIVSAIVACGSGGGTESGTQGTGSLMRTGATTNPAPYIPSQCYTKTEDAAGAVHNPCYACHITSVAPNYIDDADVPAALASAGGKLLAFGLGAQASPIGKSNGGLEAAPYCEVLKKTYYRPYILLVRLSASGAVTRAEFAGVLDPLGNTVRAARQALK